MGKHGENPGKTMEDWGDFMEKPRKNGERSEKSKKNEDLNSRTSVNIDVFQENLGFHPRKTVMMVFHVRKHCVDVWYMNNGLQPIKRGGPGNQPSKYSQRNFQPWT